MKTKWKLASLCTVLLIFAACTDDNTDNWVEIPILPPPGAGTQYPQIEFDTPDLIMPGEDGFDNMPRNIHPYYKNGGRIVDFSRVGYRWGDEAIPDVPVVMTLNPPADGADAMDMIQAAIDEVAEMPLNGRFRGAILLKKGVYNVRQQIRLNASGVVLRGEGSAADGTVIRGTGVRTINPESTSDAQNLITVGGSGTRQGTKPESANVKGSFVPEGQFWVRVTNPADFKVNDNVVVYREVNDKWVSDLGMTPIWTSRDWYNRMSAERVVTKVWRDTVWFENPLPISIESQYGGGFVYKYSYDNRVSDCGIENLALESEFFADENERHCWNGVGFSTSEHCWMRNVTGKYFGMGLAFISATAKNITVENCECTDFQATRGGSRRYPFFHCGQLSLMKNCRSSDARHPFATSGNGTVGPNVFLGGTGFRVTEDTGPHMRMSTATLYDNVVVDGQFNIRNRYSNSSHGWAGANEVAWNCETSQFEARAWGFIIQSPQVSGKNYAIGCIGQQRVNTFDIGCDPPSGPGVYISHGAKVAPLSLYEAQMALRKETQPGGVFDVE